MAEIALAFWLVGFIIFVVMICSIYAGQKWAYKCFKELEKLNAKIKKET